jgi:Undecaprenyl-phosphate glucose phosphotransferase
MKIAADIKIKRKESTIPDRVRLISLSAALDFVVLASVLFVTSLFYHHFALQQDLANFNNNLYAGFSLAVALVFIIVGLNMNNYNFGQSRQNVPYLRRSLYIWIASFGCVLLTAFFLKVSDDLSRAAILTSFFTGACALLTVRAITYRSTEKQIAQGTLRYQRAIVVGVRANVISYLYKHQLWKQGCSLAGAIYLDDEDEEALKPRALQRKMRDIRPDTILMIGDWSDFSNYPDIMNKLSQVPASICFIPTNLDMSSMKLGVTRIGDQAVITLNRQPLTIKDRILKRAFDIVCSLSALIALAPVFIAIAIAIKWNSSGPVFYRQNRQGFNNDVFTIWKFRSMSVMERDNEFVQAQKNDPRITKVGAFLRKTNLDELPQLINVLEGTMSIVGPRPHAVAHNSMFEDKVAKYARRHHVKPGITGWAQVSGCRGETKKLEQMQDRVRHDLHYIETWSFAFDLWIILLTVFSRRSYRNAG